MVTGDSQEEVLIFRYKQTDTHLIIIYISSSGPPDGPAYLQPGHVAPGAGVQARRLHGEDLRGTDYDNVDNLFDNLFLRN